MAESCHLNKLDGKRVLVTGGAGFIGSNIVEFLLTKTNVSEVRVLDNLSTGFQSNVDLFDTYKSCNRYSFVKGSISDKTVCEQALVDIDIICSQAALGSVPRSMDDPIISCESNVTGFVTLLQTAREMGVKRVVYASSSSVFGTNKDKKKFKMLGEPLSVYAVTKLFNEKVGTIFTQSMDMEVIGLRYFNVFGNRQSVKGEYPAVIPIFMNQVRERTPITILGDGMFSRDFTYVANVVYANVLAMTTDNETCFGSIYNIGCDSSTTIKCLAEKIIEYMKPIYPEHVGITYKEERKGDVPMSHANISDSVRELGYSVLVDIDSGLRELCGL
jgi:UDP-N-acetylglucosamine 4-epimerase